MSSAQRARSLAEQFAAAQLVVEARTHRRPALVALRGELDLLSAETDLEAGVRPDLRSDLGVPG